MSRSHQLTLWPVEDEPKKAKRKSARRVVCQRCRASLPKKPRSTMPVTHAVETVRGILIDRLDGALADLTRIALEEAGEYVTDSGTAEHIAIRFIQAAQVRLFPEEFGDAPPYTPDPAARMDLPANPLGLVPRLPTMAIYARHLLEVGKQSPAASLTTADGKPVFNDADLARLGERITARNSR